MRTPSISNLIPASRRFRAPSRNRSFQFIATMLLSLAWFWHSSAAAQSEMTARAASQIVDGCVAHAKGKRQSHAIAVYDRGGYPVAILRMDGNPPGVTEFAMQKAAAVAHWQFSTAEMQNAARETPGFASAPKVVTVPGGVPVYSQDGKQLIGAVGVSGEAPNDDAACAEAGIRAAGFALKRTTAS
jgi:glc operon protein GlcG